MTDDNMNFEKQHHSLHPIREEEGGETMWESLHLVEVIKMSAIWKLLHFLDCPWKCCNCSFFEAFQYANGSNKLKWLIKLQLTLYTW